MSLTDAGLRNDPRIKKALASQFDAFTNSLMNAAPPPLPQPTQIFVQQSNAAASTSATQSTVLSILAKEESRLIVFSKCDLIKSNVILFCHEDKS